MTEDRKRIISYPYPQDLIVNGELSLPVRLAKGFLLDNRGVTKNTVFLKMTYEEYSNLDSPLSLKELKELVLDYYPITVLYDCGKSNDYVYSVLETCDLGYLITGINREQGSIGAVFLIKTNYL